MLSYAMNDMLISCRSLVSRFLSHKCNSTHLAPTMLKLRETTCSCVYADNRPNSSNSIRSAACGALRIWLIISERGEKSCSRMISPVALILAKTACLKCHRRSWSEQRAGIGQKVLIKAFSSNSICILSKEDNFVAVLTQKLATALRSRKDIVSPYIGLDGRRKQVEQPMAIVAISE